ncbi:MAG: FAD-dependent oxidoreductase [Aquabacterium sp.]
MAVRDIAVIGAGVAGLAVASLLARAGNRVRLLERFSTSRPLGAGLLLQPTGLAALDRLGLRETAVALGAPIHRLEGQGFAGRAVFDVRYGDLTPGLFGLGVHRAMLHRILWDHFAASGATLETAAEVVDLQPAAGGGACPVGSDGRVHARADLVIDASGAGSALRALLGGKPARPYDFGAMWTVVPDHGFASDTLAQRYDGARVMLGHLPVGRVDAAGTPLAAVFWSLRRAEMADWPNGFAAWRAEASRRWPNIAPALASLPGPEVFSPALYAQFTARRPWRDGLVLVGDAAHATSPQMGQGANQGLVDAVVLADALAGTGDTGAALAQYAAVRRSHVRFYQMASIAMTPLFQSRSRLLGVMRDVMFPLLPRLPWLRREMVRALAGLKTGVLSTAEAGTIVDAGRRGVARCDDRGS